MSVLSRFNRHALPLMHSSRWLRAGTTAALLAVCSALSAQNYPARPIRLIVPLAAGSPADVASRFVAEELSKALGQSVFVVNKPGAGGTIAMADLARAEPDGYTIGFASQGTLVFNQAIYANPGYDSLRDFAPIALLGRASNVMITHPGNPASSPSDIVARAKAKPGTLTFASGGNGTTHHVAGVLFGQVTGTDLVHVPYKGAPQAVLAVMADEVTLGFFNVSAVIQPIRDGRVKALGVTSLERLPLLPNVPTLDQQGIRGFDVNTWAGFIAPAKSPAEAVERLHAELTRIFSGGEFRKWLASQGLEPPPALTPTAFTKLIADDLAVWVPVVKSSGAKAD